MHRSSLFDAFPLPRLTPDSDGAGTGETPPAVDPTVAPAITPAPDTTAAPDRPPAFSQADVDRLVGKAREEGKKAAKDELERKRADDEARAKGEWEKVATAKDAEVERLKGELAQRDRALLVARVAAKHQLPDTIATRLIGDDEAALDADAKTLAKEIGARTAPETEAGAGTNGTRSRVGDTPKPKPLDGPVYGFQHTKKVPWPDRAPTQGR